jgi:hypothetical protein
MISERGMMSDLQFQPLWGDPPASRGGGKNKQVDKALEAFIALMRTAPGRWAELSALGNEPGHPASRANIIKQRYPDAEIQTRRVEGDARRRRIWVRIKANVPDVIASNGDRQQAIREQATTDAS